MDDIEYELVDELESATLDRSTLLRAGGVGLAALIAAPGVAADLANAQRPRPQRGGTLRYATTGGASETLAPGRAILIGELVQQYCLFDRLFEVAPNGRVQPGLAQSASVSANGRRWTIRLRQGVRFHNGRPLTAADVVYTMRTWTDPMSRYRGFVEPFINFDSIRARDRRTIEIRMKRPLADLPGFLAHQNAGILPRGAEPFSQSPIGTGPFRLVSFTPGRQTVMVRNSEYWRTGQPYVNRVINDSSYRDEASRINAVLSGAADICIYADFALARAQAGSSRVNVLAKNANAHLAFVMRLDKRPFNDPRVRKAMKLIANRQQLVNQVLYRFGQPGNDLMGPYCRYFASNLKRSPDIERARSLLRAAGATDLRLELVTNDTTGFTEAATLFQEQARAAGVSIQLRQIPSSTYYTGAAGWPNDRPFGQIRRGGAAFINLSALYFSTFWSGATSVPDTGFGNPGTDRLLFDAIGETNPARARDKWFAVQKRQFDQGGHIVWAAHDLVDVMNPRIRGIVGGVVNDGASTGARLAWFD